MVASIIITNSFMIRKLKLITIYKIKQKPFIIECAMTSKSTCFANPIKEKVISVIGGYLMKKYCLSLNKS